MQSNSLINPKLSLCQNRNLYQTLNVGVGSKTQSINLAASISIKNKNNVWINDNMVSQCHNFDNCHIIFGMYYRKHHCRYCGNIFCYKCVNQTIEIPHFIIDKPDPADYWNPSYYVKKIKPIEDKVCFPCYKSIKERIASHNKIVEMCNNPCSIEQIRNVTNLNENIRNYYLDLLRNIQYYLPNHVYTAIDIKILKANSQYISGHSKYMVHFIKSTDWTLIGEMESVINILSQQKTKSCEELYCTRTCQEILSFDDCVNILSLFPLKLVEVGNIDTPRYASDLLKYLFSIMANTPEEVIICHLPFFVSLIKYNTDANLHALIFELIIRSKKMMYHIFWLLTNEKQLDSSSISNFCIDKFLGLFHMDIRNKMQLEYEFYSGLIDNLHCPIDFLVRKFNEFKPIPVPYDPDILLLEVYLDDIIIKESFTKPVIIKFETNFGTKRILFKKDSIRNDLVVLNLIKLSDIILTESMGINFGAITYPVMPITANSGMIELVDNSETIYSICNKKELWQHIFQKNEDKIISDVMTTYMYSLVSYTLQSYFIGLGDRHLENIMITDDGKIFHIDFGFILGKEAYPITSTDIKLNTNILEVLGCQGGTMYNRYLELCHNGVIILRKYFNMFFILLELSDILCDSGGREKHIENFIMSRFQPRQTDYVVFNELLSVIQQSNNAFIDIIRDFMHYHNREKTIPNGFSRVVNSAVHCIKNIVI